MVAVGGVEVGMVEAEAEGILAGAEEGQALLAGLVTGHAQAAATTALPASRRSARAANSLIDLTCTTYEQDIKMCTWPESDSPVSTLTATCKPLCFPALSCSNNAVCQHSYTASLSLSQQPSAFCNVEYSAVCNHCGEAQYMASTGLHALDVAHPNQQMLAVVGALGVVEAMVVTVGVVLVGVVVRPALKRPGRVTGPAQTATISVLPVGRLSQFF